MSATVVNPSLFDIQQQLTALFDSQEVCASTEQRAEIERGIEITIHEEELVKVDTLAKYISWLEQQQVYAVDVEQLILALGPGAAEYERVLQAFGVKSPLEFRSSRPARMCATKERFLCLARAKELEAPKPKLVGTTASDAEAALTEYGYGN